MKANPTTSTAPAAASVETGGLSIVHDANNREIAIASELDVLDEMRILKILGGENSQYLYFCTQLARVKKIGGEAVPLPNSDREFQALAKRLGRPGVNRVIQFFLESEVSATDEGSDDKGDAEREAVKK